MSIVIGPGPRVTLTGDLELLRYDVARYPFHRWVLDRLLGAGIPVTELARLHEAVSTDDLGPLLHVLSRATEGEEFQGIYHAFVREVLQPMVPVEVAPQRFVNVRALLPTR